MKKRFLDCCTLRHRCSLPPFFPLGADVSDTAIEVQDLVRILRVRNHEPIQAVNGLPFRVQRGEVHDLPGPDGIGRNTFHHHSESSKLRVFSGPFILVYCANAAKNRLILTQSEQSLFSL